MGASCFIFLKIKSKKKKVAVANMEKRFFWKGIIILLLIIIIIHVTILYNFSECLKYFIIKQLKILLIIVMQTVGILSKGILNIYIFFTWLHQVLVVAHRVFAAGCGIFVSASESF